MARDAKQEPRKTVWRGISVKTDNQPTSNSANKSGRASISWERPLSPLSQPEHNSGIKTIHGIQKLDEKSQSWQDLDERQASSTISPTVAVSPTNSTAVSSTKSSSKSSKHKKEKLANLGSLTKTPEPTSSASQKKNDGKVGRSLTLGSLTKPNDQNDVRAQKERERKERKDMEKQARKERKDQEKLEKKRKEQQKKELKLLKEVERKERKSRTSSFLFSRSSKSSAPSSIAIDTASNSTTEDKPKSPLERRSLLSFGRHSLASLTSKPSNASTTEIVTPEPPLGMSNDVTTGADSSSDEFMDFVDSQMSIHSDKSSTLSISIPQQKTTHPHPQNSPSSPTPLPTQQVEPTSQSRLQARTSKLADHMQQQAHRHSSPYSTNHGNDSSTSSITSSNSKTSNSTTPINTNHSMLYILNSLQDAGRDIEDDDLLDDHMANKMEESQQQNQTSNVYQSNVCQVHPQLDQHIQPPASTYTERPCQIQQSGTNRLLSSQQHLPGSSTDPLPTSPTISHCSSTSSSSYDTVSQAGTLYSPSIHESQQQQQSDHHWERSSPTGTTDISEYGDTNMKKAPNSPIPGPITVEATNKVEQHGGVLLDSSTDDNIEEDRCSTISDNSDGHQVDMNEQQNQSKNHSVESKETSNPSSHVPIDEIKLAHDYGESPELHITGKDQAKTNNELSPTTNHSTAVCDTVDDLQLTDDKGTDNIDDDEHDNTTQLAGNGEHKCDDMLLAIQHSVDVCDGQPEVMENIQHSVEDNDEHDDVARAPSLRIFYYQRKHHQSIYWRPVLHNSYRGPRRILLTMNQLNL
ncbi:hypothetical protein BCR42DRAFT_197823 [Absidia repens]|uniref:Uncharacterized protein n=1 Tax=Absidia repens TaxID=90262 RepID=A0A1X2IT36_9FUNG|nr:hypothetical protein BCR42DRAFT_197823 [Absidia repens]